MSKAKGMSLGKIKRISVAKKWIEEYKGKNIINDYSRYFGVNEIRTINDLEILGITFEESYKKKIIEKTLKKEEHRKK